MKFLVKDLMVTILPFEPQLPSGDCDAGSSCACTCTPCTGGCSPCSDCSSCSTSTPGSIDWISQVYDPAVLARLAGQLRVALATVEAREAAVREELRPTSQTQVDVLKAHLTSALEELKTMPVGNATKGSAGKK